VIDHVAQMGGVVRRDGFGIAYGKTELMVEVSVTDIDSSLDTDVYICLGDFTVRSVRMRNCRRRLSVTAQRRITDGRDAFPHHPRRRLTI